MSSTTTTTNTTTFDGCIEQLAEAMNQSYFFDENGAPVDMDDEQKDGVEKTIDQVKNVAIETFGPLFQNLSAQIAEQGKRIELLRASVGTKGAIAHAGASKSSPAGALALAEDSEGLPTAAWLIANRKSKSGKDITGYNCFTMHHMAKNKSGFPPKGLWDQQNKAAWNALAKQVNSGSSGTDGVSASASASASASPAEAPIDLPQTKGKGQKLTAYNMYTIDYMAKNPGGGFPPKGSWAKVPKEEVARYQAQADALKAQRA
jgi:hypothetical protein